MKYMKTQILKQTAIFFLLFSFASLFMSTKLQAQVAQIKKQPQIPGNTTHSENKLLNTEFFYEIIDTSGNDIDVNEQKMIRVTSVATLPGKDSTTKTATIKIA